MNKLLYPYRPQREDLGYTRASLQNLSSQGLLLPPTQTCNKQRVDTTNMACVFFAFPSGIALWTPKPFRSSGLFSFSVWDWLNKYTRREFFLLSQKPFIYFFRSFTPNWSGHSKHHTSTVTIGIYIYYFFPSSVT